MRARAKGEGEGKSEMELHAQPLRESRNLELFLARLDHCRVDARLVRFVQALLHFRLVHSTRRRLKSQFDLFLCLLHPRLSFDPILELSLRLDDEIFHSRTLLGLGKHQDKQ